MSTVLVLIAVVAFVWGLERWRKQAAARAGRSSRARVTALARCLLGPDGTTVMRSPDDARERLRALAMATPAEGAVTWFDRCVPLAAALARHASEVDNTHAVTAAETRVADSARALYEAMRRVGLVWRIRAGDPETDMDAIAARLARTAGEIDLAGAEPAPRTSDGPVAPAPPALAEGTLLAIPGLEPALLGGPDRFYVGSPLPSVTEVVRENDAYRHDTLANEPSVAWHLGAQSLTRIDVPLEPAPDGLAPLRYFRPGDDEPAEARVTAVTDALEGLHVALAAVPAGRALWVAQWTPWNGAVLARFVPNRTAAALTLAQAPLDATARATDPTAGRATTFDEHVAIARHGTAGGVVVAYTQHMEGGRARVVLAASAGDNDRATVTRLGEREVAGRAPELEFCERASSERPGAAPVLLVAGAREWVALAVTPQGELTELVRVAARTGRTFDERLAVRCGAVSNGNGSGNGGRSGLVAFAREHPRSSPVLVCDEADAPGDVAHPALPRCRSLDAPDAPTLSTMPLYTTRTRDGRSFAHAEWPVLFDAGASHVIAARAAGPVVAIARRPRVSGGGGGAWSPERVVFDAAAHAHGETVEGLGVYAAGQDVTLAIATPGGLRVLRSTDAGETFR